MSIQMKFWLGMMITTAALAADNKCLSPPIDPQHIPAPWQLIRSPSPDWRSSFSIVKYVRDFNIVLCQYGDITSTGFALQRSASLPVIPPAPWYPRCIPGIDAYCCKESIDTCQFIPI